VRSGIKVSVLTKLPLPRSLRLELVRELPLLTELPRAKGFSETNYSSRLGTPPFATTVSVVATAHHVSLPNTSRTPTQCPDGCAAAH
jgi:hypothetical protein